MTDKQPVDFNELGARHAVLSPKLKEFFKPNFNPVEALTIAANSGTALAPNVGGWPRAIGGAVGGIGAYRLLKAFPELAKRTHLTGFPGTLAALGAGSAFGGVVGTPVIQHLVYSALNRDKT